MEHAPATTGQVRTLLAIYNVRYLQTCSLRKKFILLATAEVIFLINPLEFSHGFS